MFFSRLTLILTSLMLCIGSISCTSEKSAPQTELLVFAASSLTDVFLALEKEFKKQYPDVDVQFSFAGSQILRLQIEQGAPADLFASANLMHIQKLRMQKLVEKPSFIAENKLVILLSQHEQNIKEFSQLPQAQKILMGAKNTPIGHYTRQMLARADDKYGKSFTQKVLSHVVSEESNVRLLRAKVEMGEADATVLYQSDVASLQQEQRHFQNIHSSSKKSTQVMRIIAIPNEINVKAQYAIAQITKSAHAEEAQRWIAFLSSPIAKNLFKSFGFLLIDAPS